MKRRQIFVRQILIHPGKFWANFARPPVSLFGTECARAVCAGGGRSVAGRAGVRVGRQLIASENNPSARARIRCGGAARPSAVRRGGVRCVGLGGSSSRAITISARARATSTRSSSSSQQGWAGGVLAGWLSFGVGGTRLYAPPAVSVTGRFFEIFARCARRQILNQILKNPDPPQRAAVHSRAPVVALLHAKLSRLASLFWSEPISETVCEYFAPE